MTFLGMHPRTRLSATLALGFSTALGSFLGFHYSGPFQGAPPTDQAEASSATPDLAELRALYAADQADRTPGTAPKDWQEIERRDQERQARVQALLDAGAAKTGRDYFHAAMVFQHASTPEGIQLAHELAMIAACLGDRGSRWLAAASYDRYLMYLDRPQRFGTQYRSDADGVMKLYNTAPGVSDAMRAALDVPSLAEAQAREAEMQAQIEALRKVAEPTGGQ
jgi:hypothetical protein